MDDAHSEWHTVVIQCQKRCYINFLKHFSSNSFRKLLRDSLEWWRRSSKSSVPEKKTKKQISSIYSRVKIRSIIFHVIWYSLHLHFLQEFSFFFTLNFSIDSVSIEMVIVCHRQTCNETHIDLIFFSFCEFQ